MEKVFGDLVPTLCVGTPSGRFASRTAHGTGREASGLHSHAKRGNENVCEFSIY
ncbi:hypothetical protein QUF90_22615 [Desulfococcaceae bacterium HSG9]|nr:hypothetical protein [Desulfococcaceae bacterium HSG9]